MERKLLTHPSFPQPKKNTDKVWRYLTLSKFLDFFLSKSLYFARVDYLEDTHEGTYTKLNTIDFPFVKTQLPSGGLPLTQEEYTKRLRTANHVNCWRIDNNDSEAMWKLYCPNSEGIAIQTTYEKLANSLPDEKYLFMGLINYRNYETETFNRSNHFNTVMHKRIAFEFEKEIRIVKGNIPFMNDHNLPLPEVGIKIKTSLLQNIEKIYINPYAGKWYFQTIQGLFERFNINLDLEWSEINSPIYY